MLILDSSARNQNGNHRCIVWVMAKGAQRRGSIIFDHEGAPCIDRRFHRRCKGRWRGVLSRGFGPDSKRLRYKISGRTKQHVVEAEEEGRGARRRFEHDTDPQG